MSTDTLEAVTIPERMLLRTDRCDRCGSQAYFQVVKNRLELLFCAHHGRQHEVALVMNEWTMYDSTHLLDQ